MRRLVVLGAGTAGTMVVNKLHHRLGHDWEITVVEQSDLHHYQPGYLFLPFGTYGPSDVMKPTRAFVPEGVNLVSAVTRPFSFRIGTKVTRAPLPRPSSPPAPAPIAWPKPIAAKV
jgi:NADPH-dependent 2,4-dienoyl-CoA reductase/sulfur reductase-like enzyme